MQGCVAVGHCLCLGEEHTSVQQVWAGEKSRRTSGGLTDGSRARVLLEAMVIPDAQVGHLPWVHL